MVNDTNSYEGDWLGKLNILSSNGYFEISDYFVSFK